MAGIQPPYGVPPPPGDEPPGFLARLIQLPFRPGLWRQSAEYGLGSIVLPLMLLVLIVDTGFGIRAAARAREAVYAAAAFYEENADPLILEKGRFRIDGERVLFTTHEEITILIDPTYRVADEEITTERYLVVRDDRVIVQQPRQTRVVEAEDVAEFFGEDPLVIDAAFLRQMADGLVYPLVIAGYAVFATCFDFAAWAIYAVVVGGLLLLLRGRRSGLDYAQCAKLALATSAATVVLELVLILLEAEPGVPGPILWPLTMLVLGMLALAGGRPSEV